MDDKKAQTPAEVPSSETQDEHNATPEEMLAEQDPSDPEVGVDGTGVGALP